MQKLYKSLAFAIPITLFTGFVGLITSASISSILGLMICTALIVTFITY